MANENSNQDLGAQGDKNTVKGKLNQVVGNAQEKLGEVTNDPNQQAQGQGKQIKGNVQEGVGKIERKADDVLGQ